jgi:hypothetical protein
MKPLNEERRAGRAAALAAALCGAAMLAGCASAPPRTTAGAGPGEPARHCVLDNRGRVRVCSTQAVPGPEADREAKRLSGEPAALTVYVVRQSWGDSRELLRLSVDGRPADIETTPDSLVRLRLAPGEHRLAFEHAGQQRSTQIVGAAGEVRVLWIRREPWSFARELLWGVEPETATRERVKQTRLVADIRQTGAARQ